LGLSIFNPFKSAATDAVVLALLQQGTEYLCHTFGVCMPYGFIPTAWMQLRVMFIPKPRKADYMGAKAYHPISPSSFLLKITEKLVNRHIQDGALRRSLLHRNKHAYQTGISIETALHNVITRTENACQQ
jgi:hypothetical protein